jgi:hypothetical protein
VPGRVVKNVVKIGLSRAGIDHLHG